MPVLIEWKMCEVTGMRKFNLLRFKNLSSFLLFLLSAQPQSGASNALGEREKEKRKKGNLQVTTVQSFPDYVFSSSLLLL